MAKKKVFNEKAVHLKYNIRGCEVKLQRLTKEGNKITYKQDNVLLDRFNACIHSF